MPRVEIPLSGWQQVPDERTGQPRIARLTNCRVENQGRITKSPGQAALPTTSDGNAITKPLTVGPDFAVFQDSGGSLQPGFRLARLIGSSWAYHTGEADYLSSVEAPRLTKLFADEDSHYLHCGVLECGNGDLVVYAEKVKGWNGSTTTDDVDNIGTVTIAWALLTASSGLTPVKRGELAIGIDSMWCYPASSGPFLVAWYNAYLLIWKWNTTTNVFDVITSGTALSGPGRSGSVRSQLDVWYSQQNDRLHVAGRNGTIQCINATTGAFIAAVSVNSYAALYIDGAIGITGADAVWDDGGTMRPLLFVAYQTAAKDWGFLGLKMRTTGFSGGVGPYTAAYTSPQNIPNLVTNNAARRPVCCYASGTFHAVLPCKKIVSTADSGEIDSVVVSVGYTSAGGFSGATASAVALHRMAATKPTHDANNGVVWWSYDGTTRSLRSAELTGRALVTTDQPKAKTLALIGGDPGVSPMAHYQEPTGAMVRSSYLPPTLTGTTEYRTGWVAALMVQKTADSRACNVYLATAGDGFANTASDASGRNKADVGQIARHRGVTFIASGHPQAYVGEPTIPGFYVPPLKATFVESAGSGIPNGETHSIVYVLRYESANGDIVWGPVSDIATYTNSSGSAKTVGYYIVLADDIPADWKASVFVYQSYKGVFRLVNGPLGATYSYFGDYLLVYLNNASEMASYWSSQPILYTQGANGALSGQLDHFGPPPCRTIWTGRNRVICGGLANERQVHWSTIAFPTEALAWPQDATFKAEVDEPVTAVAALDDYWFIFSERSIWVVTGEGPDNLGNGTFEDPLRVSTGLGCISWRSVVETPLGLMFQGNNGQIYLIARGTTSPTMASQGIRDSLTSNARYDADFHEQWIIGAVYDPLAQEVWFSTHYRDWVLQLETLAWREELHPLSYCRGASYFESRSIGSCGYAGPVVIRDAKMHRLRRHDTDSYVYLDVLGAERQFSIETSDIDLGYRGRIRRGWLRVVRDRNSSSLLVETWNAKLWYDGKSREQTHDESVTLSGSESPALDAYSFADLEFCPARQKCNQVRIKFTGGDGVTVGGVLWDVLGVAFDIMPSKDSPVKTTQGSGRMK